MEFSRLLTYCVDLSKDLSFYLLCCYGWEKNLHRILMSVFPFVVVFGVANCSAFFVQKILVAKSSL